MKFRFTISLRNRLALSYTLFIGAALGILALAINLFTGITFNALIRENITRRSAEIVRSIAELYNPMTRGFDGPAVEALGMYFVHEGYIVSVEDARGQPVWDARSCDMQQCRKVIDDIASRMERDFRLNGAMRTQRYPVFHSGEPSGAVTIETYGPFFYSETETEFLTSINRLLLIAGLVLVLLCAGVSLALSRSIAKPVLKAAEAARQIARAHSGGSNPEGLVIRINDRYKTGELQELSRSINDLAAELEEGERRQKRLTSDLAHELRTPLTCLQGNMEAMIDGVYKPDREHLESCHEEIIRLASLVEDLSILTGIEWETLKLNKTDFDLASLLQATAKQFKAAARAKGIELRMDVRESPIHADYDRLKQVFINLLSNALKYTDKGSIDICVNPINEGGGSIPPGGSRGWEVTIADTGIGIPEEDIPHIFERFYRSDKSRSRSTGGAGIGLTIAAAIVAAHGGTISAEKRSGGQEGSVFRIRL
jgi:signal transduction histidine kinase